MIKTFHVLSTGKPLPSLAFVAYSGIYAVPLFYMTTLPNMPLLEYCN